MKPLMGPVFAREDYAGFIRRTVALCIDALILLAIDYALGEALIRFAPDSWIAEDGYINPGVEIAYHFSFWPMSILYLFGFRLSINGTPGYRIVRIRYAYALGEKAPVLSIAYRAAVAVFLLWFFALDHIWILFDPHKQAWHDKVSGFYVVKCKARPNGTQPMSRRLINFMMLTFPVWEIGRASCRERV